MWSGDNSFLKIGLPPAETGTSPGRSNERIRGTPSAQVNLHAVRWNRNCPEQAAWLVPRANVNDLNGLRLVRKDIYSEEAKGSVVFLAIHST